MSADVTAPRRKVDVCMLLEGTYPYVRGGVSSWVHQILSGLPELTFALVFVDGRRSDYGQAKYELPENLSTCRPISGGRVAA